MTDGVRASATRALPGPDRLAMDRRHPVRTRTVALLQVKRRGPLPLPRSAVRPVRVAPGYSTLTPLERIGSAHLPISLSTKRAR